MAPTLPPTIPPKATSNSFPVGAIVGIAVGCYMLLFGIALIIRQILVYKGISVMCCNNDDSDDECCSDGCPCCDDDNCLWNCTRAWDCDVPNRQRCMDYCCPTKEWCDKTCCFCMSLEPRGNCCENCHGPECECGGCCNCNCQCQMPKTINCICFEINCDPGS